MPESSLRELTEHGKKNFPLCVYHNISDGKYALGYHWHNEVEFIYLSQGNAVLHIDSQAIRVHEGEAVFIRSGQVHACNPADTQAFEFYSIVFNLNMLCSDTIGSSQNKFISPLVTNRCTLPQHYDNQDFYGRSVIHHLATITREYCEQNPGYEMSILAALYSIVSLTISCGYLETDSRGVDEADEYKLGRFKQVLDYIHNNYKNKLRIDDLAAEINLSPYHFCRFFKQLSGKTPFEYLNEYRISKACYLLQTTDCKITSIALDTGFPNFSYFIKLFKEIKGITPSDYRKHSSYSNLG